MIINVPLPGMIALGDEAAMQGDLEKAEALYREALAGYEMLGDPQGAMLCKGKIANVLADRGNWQQAEALYWEALVFYKGIKDMPAIAAYQDKLAALAFRQGNRDKAEALYREALAIYELLGDSRSAAMVKNSMGILAAQRGYFQTAKALFHEALAVFESLQEGFLVFKTMGDLAEVAARLGDLDAAEALNRQALTLTREFGSHYHEAAALLRLGDLAVQRGNRKAAEDLFRDAWTLATQSSIQEQITRSSARLASLGVQMPDSAGSAVPQKRPDTKSKDADQPEQPEFPKPGVKHHPTAFSDRMENIDKERTLLDHEPPSAPPPPPAYAPPAAAAPQRSREAPRVSRPRAKKEKWERLGKGPEPTPPHFSAYYPSSVGPKKSYALMAFVHLASARDQVREVAAGYLDLMGGQQTSESTPGTIQIDVGSLITFVVILPGVTLESTEKVAIWNPPYQSVTFPFTTPADLQADLEGRIQVYQGPLIVGEIPVKMAVQVKAESGGLDAESDLERFDPVFASYSHKDTPVMEYFRRARENMGQKMLVDVYDLRAGEHWAPRLLEMIDSCAVFQLFWSRYSAQSAYCRQEWEYALRYVEERPRFIQPVYWQKPMPTVPPELANLHFQRVMIPAATRLQLSLARIKMLFGRG